MKHLLIAAAVATGAIAAFSTESSAASYDGAWSVLIVTQQGQCDRAYRYPLTIRDGVVSYGGNAGFNVSGRVEGTGAVRVSVTRGNQGADGTGKLSAKTGSGTWKAPAGGCSGTWKAEKRG